MISSAAGNKVNYCASSAPLNFRFQGGVGYRISIPVLKTGLVPPKRLQISNYALNDKNVYFVYFLLFSQTGLSLLYQEINECQYIQTLRVSKSISYRTSNIEYLDMLKAGVSKSRYFVLSLPIKYSILVDFIKKKWVHFIKKIRCDKFSNLSISSKTALIRYKAL